MSNITVCGRTEQLFLLEIEKFHGWKAPGLVLGAYMVDLARQLIGHDVEADAIVETRHCLPDAIQLFTPCTIGNGWLKILDWDKFALCLYDRHTQQGYRVWLDLAKTKKVPDLYNWYMRLVPKNSLPLEVMIKTILDAGKSVLSSRAVKVTRFYQREKKGNIEICPCCNEAFPASQGSCCTACQGGGYYT